MSLLFDENLSPRLAARLASLFPGCIHVRDVGLQQADDREIWQWAGDNGHTLVTTDSDFVVMAEQIGPPSKVIHIERCDFPFHFIEDLVRQNGIRIARFEQDASGRLLSLRPIRGKASR